MRFYGDNKRACNRIKELRLAQGFTSLPLFVHFVNHELGYEISVQAMSRLEQHQTENPYWELVNVLSKYFGVTAEYLMGTSDKNLLEPMGGTSLTKEIIHNQLQTKIEALNNGRACLVTTKKLVMG